MTDIPTEMIEPPPMGADRGRSTGQRWLLRAEAIVCFGAPTLGLMSAFVYWPLLEGRAGGHETLLNIGIVVNGVLGLYGLFALTNAATHPERRVRWPRWVVLSLCLGAVACGAAVRVWDFGVLTVIVLPLVGIGHFLFLTRRQWGDLALDSSAIGRTLGRWVAVVIAAAVGAVLAGPQMGLQADYTIARTISRAAIEAEYGPLLDQVDKLPEPPLKASSTIAELERQISADSTLIYVRLDVTPPTKSNALWFEKANRNLGEFECYMRSEVMQLDGLIRCRMTSDGQLVDMLRYGRYGLGSTRPSTASRNLEVYFDYQKLSSKFEAQ